MSAIEDRLTEIDHLLARCLADDPERKLKALIDELNSDQLTEWRPKIEKSIGKFRPKRRRNLSAFLESALFEQKTAKVDPREAPDHKGLSAPSTLTTPARTRIAEPDPDLATDFRRALDELRERHIFQWSTFYRDCLAEYLPRFLRKMGAGPSDDDARSLSELLADHTRETFLKGYEFALGAHGHDEAVRKSSNGLSRFLALPLDFYSVRSSAPSEPGPLSSLRLSVSAAMSGILDGYASTSFGRQKGSAVLPRFQRSWMHYVAFLIPRHAENVVDRLDAGSLADGLRTSVLPLLDALEMFYQRSDDYRPLPVAGQYAWRQRRLDVTVRPPRDAVAQRLVEVNAFLDEGFVSMADMEDAARRQVTLVIAPLRPDVQKMVSERRELAEIVVPASGTRDEVTARSFRIWNSALGALHSDPNSTVPITLNFARHFPLHDQNCDRATLFHVARTSVRDLLRTFERRPGARLWCSVRRSGKTTACLDLDSTSGDSNIVSQTCGAARPQGDDGDDDTRFYSLVCEAVEKGRMISRKFVEDAVAKCAPPSNDEDKQLVLVLDEYETLFNQLKTAVEREPNIRYTVVQPFLNQLMTFSYDNLLVLLGQQPDAHFILMDQNQLAPYVQQDAFPLFEHAPRTTVGEFPELVRKILTDRIECTASFLDALFEETAGHPYLTANVLGEFVEWLIEDRRPRRGLHVRDADFTDFAHRKLNADRILLSSDYRFFRQAAAEAMSAQGYRQTPWLFTAYWALRELSNHGVGGFRVERSGFPELMARIPVPQGEPAPDCNDILQSASQANFLSYDDEWVRVRIPTLGRIAAAVRPKVT